MKDFPNQIECKAWYLCSFNNFGMVHNLELYNIGVINMVGAHISHHKSLWGCEVIGLWPSK